jgi:glycerol-3-phosphate acyltransferase PlsY
VVLAALIVFMHRENIRRLLAGREPRIGAKKNGAGGAGA